MQSIEYYFSGDGDDKPNQLKETTGMKISIDNEGVKTELDTSTSTPDELRKLRDDLDNAINAREKAAADPNADFVEVNGCLVDGNSHRKHQAISAIAKDKNISYAEAYGVYYEL